MGGLFRRPMYTHTHLFLFLDDDRELCVGNAWVQLTAHECGPLVVLDVAHVLRLGNLYVFRETLMTERDKAKRLRERDRESERQTSLRESQSGRDREARKREQETRQRETRLRDKAE